MKVVYYTLLLSMPEMSSEVQVMRGIKVHNFSLLKFIKVRVHIVENFAFD